MSQLRLNLFMVTGSTFIFLLAFVANEWIFTQSEFVRGINWIYMPAGMRLLCTLLFAEAGAIGILIASWITCFFYFFPNDPMRSFIGGILSAVAPYLVYRLSRCVFGLQVSLANLTGGKLLFLMVMYSLVNPSLLHLWLLIRGSDSSVAGFLVMIIGDLTGTLLVVYMMKTVLAFFPVRR